MSDVSEFLRKKGTIPLIYELAGEGGQIVEDLHSKIDISRQQLTDLIEEADNKGLIKREDDPKDHGNAKRLILTDRGMILYAKMVENEIYEFYETFKEAEQEFEQQKGAFVQWSEQNIVRMGNLDNLDEVTLESLSRRYEDDY